LERNRDILAGHYKDKTQRISEIENNETEKREKDNDPAFEIAI
jgi:hypothetical protein